MAALSPGFRMASQKIHREHRDLLGDLGRLDHALENLNCYSEVFANFAGMDELLHYGKLLTQQLPEHFTREEETVLATVAAVSPELADLASRLKAEHDELRARLGSFCLALEELREASDPYEVVYQVKTLGAAFSRQLSQHMALEETELAGFL